MNVKKLVNYTNRCDTLAKINLKSFPNVSDKRITAAVALIHCRNSDSLLILRRSEHPDDPWSGHYALPGGRCEENETLLETAIRECQEECGLTLTQKDLCAQLPVETAGRHVGIETFVQPFLFEIEQELTLTLDFDEIDQYHWLPCQELRDKSKVQHGKISSQHPHYSFPYYQLHDRPLWGFTYKVIMDYLGTKS